MDRKLAAYVFGGSGKIGKGIVKALAGYPQFDRVTLIGRRNIELPTTSNDQGSSNPNGGGLDYSKFDQVLIDFDKLEEYPNILQGYDVGFYALGVSSTSVSKETYHKIEHDYVLGIARLAQSCATPQFHLITGRGTNPDSMFLFGRTKAVVEEEVTKMGFKRTVFYRCGAILSGDGIGQKIVSMIDSKGCISIHADVLGRVLVENSLREFQEPVQIMEQSDISDIAKSLEQ